MNHSRISTLLALAIFTGFLGLKTTILAHDPGLSSATVEIKPDSIEALLIFNPKDLAGMNTPLDSEPQQPVSGDPKQFAGVAGDSLVITGNDKPLAVKVVGVDMDDKNNVNFHLRFARPPGNTLAIHGGLIERLPFGHREMLRVNDAAGISLGESLLSANQNNFPVTLNNDAPLISSNLGVGSIEIHKLHAIYFMLTAVVGASAALWLTRRAWAKTA